MKRKQKQDEESKDKMLVDELGYSTLVREGVKVKNFTEWTEKVLNCRELDRDNVTIQLGFDDGQDVLNLMQTVKQSEISTDANESKRRKYSDGYEGLNSPLSSVKKMFILCAVPKVDENY